MKALATSSGQPWTFLIVLLIGVGFVSAETDESRGRCSELTTCQSCWKNGCRLIHYTDDQFVCCDLGELSPPETDSDGEAIKKPFDVNQTPSPKCSDFQTNLNQYGLVEKLIVPHLAVPEYPYVEIVCRQEKPCNDYILEVASTIRMDTNEDQLCTWLMPVESDSDVPVRISIENLDQLNGPMTQHLDFVASLYAKFTWTSTDRASEDGVVHYDITGAKDYKLDGSINEIMLFKDPVREARNTLAWNNYLVFQLYTNKKSMLVNISLGGDSASKYAIISNGNGNADERRLRALLLLVSQVVALLLIFFCLVISFWFYTHRRLKHDYFRNRGINLNEINPDDLPQGRQVALRTRNVQMTEEVPVRQDPNRNSRIGLRRPS